ncbi:peroxide stress protein YaaA [Lentilactobacillus kosonis]|uniref:UPF0246 protein NBRC111893_2117 n=1 Tax=Lentilactobacillus kosonis TaxID=2810561 RepID=A0A401FP31_9LACO|nr:peroxide stress protein YaaA [Lentilactobacillus kosonis]GAY73971.1 UPF0246 protein YaaA [Lentilactobacillus kosonis]
MKFIIAPAKKMVTNLDDFEVTDLPQYLQETQQILDSLQTLSISDAKSLWKTSDKLTKENFNNLNRINLHNRLTPAVIAYSGLQYQYMAPGLLTNPALNYLQANLRILSGFYGILSPFDGIVPYRLEMQAKLTVGTHANLYSFWGDKLYRALVSDGHEPIINLASQEYSKSITPFLTDADTFIDIVFGHLVDGKLKTRATFAKMARGEMVRYAAESQLTNVNDLKKFNHLNYAFDSTRSTDKKYVFIKDEK